MSTSEYLTPSFVGGWTAVLAVAGVAGYRYYQKNYQTPKPKQKAPAPHVAPRKQNRAKKQRQEVYTSSAQKARAEDPSPKPAASPATQPSNEPDDSIDNTDFARRMARVQEGTKFAAKSGKEKKRQKSVKQSRAAEAADINPVKEEQPSAPSSTGGVDADDDASPIASPEVPPTDSAGVSDMLEPAPSGPSVLRLTDTEKETGSRKSGKSADKTKTESKKQRQNRRKAEERKAIREAEEKERKVLMEKQRRQAREAAGVPAKDGSQFMAAVKGAKSAWASSGPNGSSATVQPLDTFESSNAGAVPNESPTNTSVPESKSSAPAKLDESWITAIPSEEEQMEMLKSEEEEWNTVPSKSSKKNKKSAPKDTPSDAAAESKPAPQTSAPAPVLVNGKQTKPAQSLGSFAALTVQGDGAADEEEEQEWDV